MSELELLEEQNTALTEEKLQELWLNCAVLEKGKERMLRELKGELSALRYRENEDPVWQEKEELPEEEIFKGKHYFGPRDSTQYKELVRALGAAIHAMEDRAAEPERVLRTLHQYRRSAQILLQNYRLRRPEDTETNRKRYAVTENAAKRLADRLIFGFTGLQRCVMLPGTAELSLLAVKVRLTDIAAKNGLSLPDLTDPEIRDRINAREENMADRLTIQKEFLSRLQKVNHRKIRVGLSCTGPDEYLPKIQNPAGYDLAVDFVTKRYIEKAFHPDTTKEMLEEMLQELKDGTVQKQIVSYGMNPVFKEYAKKHENDFYTGFKEVEKKTAQMKAEFEAEGQMPDLPVDASDPLGADAQFLKIISGYMLSDEKGDYATQAMAAELLAPEKVELIIQASLRSKGFYDKTIEEKRALCRDERFLKKLKTDLLRRQRMAKLAKKLRRFKPGR